MLDIRKESQSTTNGYHWSALLIMLLGSILLEPLFGSSFAIELTSLALIELTLVGAIFFSLKDLRFRLIGAILTLIWFGCSLAAMLNGHLNGVVTLISTGMIIAAPIMTFRALLARDQGDFETLIGGVFGYLLLAVVWAMFYSHMIRWQPGSIEFVGDHDLWTSMVYFSLVTLTSLGYGDILPIHPLARIAAGLQAVVGVLYIAVMIGSIVGNYRIEKFESEEADASTTPPN